MRQIAEKVLKNRKNKILSTVIYHYIKTGRPVGSNALIDRYNNISLSPATVRNLMAELEEEGFLTHPHTSAGRVPTDKGYRAYVDSLVKFQDLAIQEQEKVKREYEQKHKETELILSETSRILSGLSQYTGFVMTPKTQYDVIKNIEFVQISKEEILVIFITQSGMIKHKKIEAFLTQDNISALRNFFNEKLRGISIAQANKKIALEVKKFKKNETIILEIAEKVGDAFYNMQDDVFINGTSNVVEIKDFDNYEPIKSIIQFNENKEHFIKIISEYFNDSGVSVKIGSENAAAEFKDFSLVTTVYENGENAVGVLGIIGPKRMEYEKMMSLVSSVSKMLNDFFKNKKK